MPASKSAPKGEKKWLVITECPGATVTTGGANVYGSYTPSSVSVSRITAALEEA